MTRSNHGIQRLKTPSTLQIEVSAKLPQFATQSFDMAAMPTYPNNNIQQTKNNSFNGNMEHRTGVLLIHILLCVQSSQHQQNTNQSPNRILSRYITIIHPVIQQIKKYTNYCPKTQVILHIQQFYQGSIVLPKCVNSSLTGGEFKDVIVCYTYLHRN